MASKRVNFTSMHKALILAAGKGSRLYPITHHIAKPLLPIANRMTMDYAFEKLNHIGITDICVVVGENEPLVKSALGEKTSFGQSLYYARQIDPKGLAHAVSFAKEFVGQDPFVLYLGDSIYSAEFTDLADRFRRGGIANLNLVKEVEDPKRFGVANLDGNRILKLVEKPKIPESNWAMAGLYFFGPELWTVLPDLKPSARGEYEITDAIQLLINRGENVEAGKYTGVWFDTGTRESFLEASRFLTNGRSLIATDSKVTGLLSDHVVVGSGAEVHCKSIENSVILPGAKVLASGVIRNSLIGGVSTDLTDIVDTILWDGKPA